MAGSDKKLQGFTSFNSGEYSQDLAGRTDLESFGSSTRYSSNFLTQVSGGLKKFYGTRHVTEQSVNYDSIKMIPFINDYEPMAFVIYGDESLEQTAGLKVGLIHGDDYKDLNITLPNTVKVEELRWQQTQDKLILCHPSTQPFEIDFYGVDDDGEYVFDVTQVAFKEVPYFPIGATDDYRGALKASALSGEITLSIPSGTEGVKAYFPGIVSSTGTYTRQWSKDFTGSSLSSLSGSVSNSTITLYRSRGGTDSALVSGIVNTASVVVTKLDLGFGYMYHISVTDEINKERILRTIQTVYPQSYIDASSIVLVGVIDHQNGDSYYMTLSVGGATYTWHSSTNTIWNSATYSSTPYTPVAIDTGTINADALIGRKIKLFFNDDAQIVPWWQGKSVTSGDYVYSNGHFYKAQNSGTCGNVQPAHTQGIRTDGGVDWLYVHSGSNTGTILSVPSSTQIKILVAEGELPVNPNNIYNNYSFSIWGKDGVHPSEVYMIGERLGFVCNTKKYGAWNAMSVSGDYYNFSTEEYGEQLDTSAIVGLIGNNESSKINWVLARKNLYMGGYSGEYFINPTGSNRRSGVYTPTGTVVENISNMGGKAVIPLKYKELNLFVGMTGKELYTIAYEYITDDYTPKSLGYLTEHIMERGIKRMQALNNLDRNIYLLHDTKQLSLFNYAAEQKILGFTELDFGDDVLDFVTTYAGGVVAGYVAVKRNDKSATISQTRGGNTLGTLTVDVEKFSKMVGADGDYGFEYGVSEWYHNSEEVDLADYGITFTGTPHATDEITVSYVAPRVTFERLAVEEPTYMFDQILQGDGTEAAFVPVPHFANRTVYIRYGDDFSQFLKVTLDENGDVSHDPYSGVILPTSKYFKVGLPMVAELHTQPAFGSKVEGHQQQSLAAYIRLKASGAFEYGSSVDFNKYFKYEYHTLAQEYDAAHKLYTGDLQINIPLGYAEAQNQGGGPYPNTSAVGINIKSDTPEPLNILSIQEIYI